MGRLQVGGRFVSSGKNVTRDGCGCRRTKEQGDEESNSSKGFSICCETLLEGTHISSSVCKLPGSRPDWIHSPLAQRASHRSQTCNLKGSGGRVRPASAGPGGVSRSVEGCVRGMRDDMLLPEGAECGDSDRTARDGQCLRHVLRASSSVIAGSAAVKIIQPLEKRP